jgi:hypothetical protein
MGHEHTRHWKRRPARVASELAKSLSNLGRGSQLLGYAVDSLCKQRVLSALRITGRWLDLESDQDLQRWLKNVKRGSRVHAGIVRRQLSRVCELLSTVEEARSERTRPTPGMKP